MTCHKVVANIVAFVYLLLQSIFIVGAFWSYKSSNGWFDITSTQTQLQNCENIHPACSSIVSRGNIFGDSIFQIGKFGGLATLTIIITITLTILIVGNTKDDDNESMRDLYLSLAIIQTAMAGVPLIISLVYNRALLLRSLPFYIMQLGIIMFFFALYFTI